MTVGADVAVTLANATCTAKDPGLEVSDLIVAVAVLPGEVVARSRTRTRRTDAKPLPSASVTTVNQPWPRAFSPWTGNAGCHLPLAVRGSVSATETASATVTMIATVLVATTIVIMTANDGIGRRSGRGSTDDAWVPMTSFPTAMSARLDRDAAATKTKMIDGIPETQRYDAPPRPPCPSGPSR